MFGLTEVKTIDPAQAQKVGLPEDCVFSPTALGFRLLSPRFNFVPPEFLSERASHGIRRCPGVTVIPGTGDFVANGETDRLDKPCVNCILMTKGTRISF